MNKTDVNTVFDFIKDEINSNDIVVFMKGTSNFPQCGYSGLVVNILKKFSVNFKDINVLDSEQLRQGIKEYSDWPTIPQVYIKGEFIGGSDILKQMYETNELEQLLKSKNII